MLADCLAVQRGERLVDLGETRARYHPLGRNPSIALPEAGENGVLDGVERSEGDVPTFARLDMIGARPAPDKPLNQAIDPSGSAPLDQPEGTGMVSPKSSDRSSLTRGRN